MGCQATHNPVISIDICLRCLFSVSAGFLGDMAMSEEDLGRIRNTEYNQKTSDISNNYKQITDAYYTKNRTKSDILSDKKHRRKEEKRLKRQRRKEEKLQERERRREKRRSVHSRMIKF